MNLGKSTYFKTFNLKMYETKDYSPFSLEKKMFNDVDIIICNSLYRSVGKQLKESL